MRLTAEPLAKTKIRCETLPYPYLHPNGYEQDCGLFCIAHQYTQSPAELRLVPLPEGTPAPGTANKMVGIAADLLRGAVRLADMEPVPPEVLEEIIALVEEMLFTPPAPALKLVPRP